MKKILIPLLLLIAATSFAQSVWVEWNLPDEWFEEIYAPAYASALFETPTVELADTVQEADIIVTISVLQTKNQAGNVTGYAQAVALLSAKYPNRLWATVMVVDNTVNGIRTLARWAANYTLE